VTWTAVGSFADGTASTLAVTNTNLGDVRIVWTGTNGSAPAVSAGGVTTWNQTVTYVGTETGAPMLIAWGVVTATGAQTVSVSNSPFEIDSQAFTPSAGTVSLDTSGHLSGTTTGAGVPGVSLTGTAGDLWCGYSVNQASTGTGNTTGVTYETTSTSNQVAWAVNSPSGAFAPNWGPSGAWDTLALMLIIGGSAPAYAPKGLVTRQARNRAGIY
jgi:hypothetical protein